MADAALTPYHAIKRALPGLRPGATAVVIGAGGLGHVAAQLLRALASCRIVAVDKRPEALEVAALAGADEALLADGLTAGEVRRAAGGRGAELVIDWGTRAELAEVVALARDGVIHVEVERVSLAQAPAAYRRLEAGDVRGRLVAVPHDEA